MGTALVRGLFAPSMLFWMHPQGCQLASGSTVPAVQDFSGRGVTITQGTASKQPLRAGVQGVPCFTFDGVNDCLQTASIDVANQGVTIAVAEYRSTTTVAVELEQTDNYNGSTSAFAVLVNDNSVAQLVPIFKGDVGLQYGYYPLAISQWTSTIYVFNKAQSGANEIKLYSRGRNLSFTPLASSNNTNTFGAGVCNIGSRNNGASLALNGSIAQIFVMVGALSDTAAAYLSLYLAQSAGIA